MFDSRVSAVMLSRGSTWAPRPWDLPYLMPPTGSLWPTGATAQAVFYDNAGGTLATATGTVEPTGITFDEAPAVMDLIPAGANFEIFLTVDSKPYQIRYGKVLRREAQFTQQPESVRTPLAFADSWPTLGIRSTWIQMVAGMTVVDNSGGGLPNGIVAPSAMMRWYKPLAGDTVAAKVSVLNQHNYANNSTSRLRVMLCGNVDMTSYLALEIEASANGSGVHHDALHLCTGTSPTAVTYRGSEITNVAADGDTYTVHYDDPTKTLSVYKGTDTTPLGSWPDLTDIVPHGPGYRYLGLGSFTTVGSYGIEATDWRAMDAI